LLLAIGLSAQAQLVSIHSDQLEQNIPGLEEAALHEGSQSPAYLSFKEAEAPNADRFFSQLTDWFEIDPAVEFKQRTESEDQLGQTHRRFNQYFNSYKIDMAWLNLHQKNGKVIAINGDFEAQPDADLTISISEEQALQLALAKIGASSYKWENQAEEDHLKYEMEDPKASYYPFAELVLMNSSLNVHEKLQLCYQFNIYAQKPLGRYSYYVSAKSGEIVYVESLLHTGDSPGTAVTAYSNTVTITTDSVGNYYRMRETGRGNGIETYDMNTGTNYSSSVDFIDSNNIWNSFTIPLDRYATDAHFGTEMTYDYFFLVHNRNSIDGNGFRLRSYVHYDRNYVNAFWDGQRMTYGDGDALNSPLTTLDICGHEVTHGLTDRTSDLIYANESGALNESFSDIFGVTVENYARPNNWNWNIGEDIGGAFRSMSNPNQYGDPDTYGGQSWIDQNCIPTSGNDRCGVHTNSGVQNFWFYLLTVGGSGTNDIGQTYNVSGLGMLKASKVAFRNNTVYLGRSSDFQQARFYSILSAVDLYGACSAEVESVTNAWHAVGVGKEYSPGVSAEFVSVLDTSFCSLPAQVQFNSNGSNALSFDWDFGNGLSSTLADPVHFYTSYGSYQVSLRVDGGSCGADTVTKTAYIRVDSSFRCSYYLGLDQSSTDCEGNIYDNGGLNGDYGLNRKDTFEISPSGGDQIALYIEELLLESGDSVFCNRDYLEVYDGGLNDKIIGKYCSNNLPPDSIISSSNRLSLILSSSNATVDRGIRANWRCLKADSLATADFSTPLDTLCNGRVSFTDQSLGGVTAWQWNFGDGTTSTERNPSHFYENDGTYTVSLIASNSIGADTLTKSNSVTIQRLAAPAVANDTACIGGRVTLGASGNGTLQWFNSPAAEQAFFNGSSLSLSNLNADSSFYVQYEQKPNAIIGSPFLISGNGYYTDTAEAMYFDVFEPMILESVILNSNESGERRVELRNSSGQLIQSKSLWVPATPTQLSIGFTIYPDTDYSLTIGSANPSLYVNTTGASYPYIMGNLMELSGNSIGPNAYPFFYYWTVRPLSCYSIRARVEAKVDTTCVLVGSTELEELNRAFTLYPNPSAQGFQISGLSQNDRNINLEIFSIEGKLLSSKHYTQASDLQEQLLGESLHAAVYFIRLNVNGITEQFKWVKTQ